MHISPKTTPSITDCIVSTRLGTAVVSKDMSKAREGAANGVPRDFFYVGLSLKFKEPSF